MKLVQQPGDPSDAHKTDVQTMLKLVWEQLLPLVNEHIYHETYVHAIKFYLIFTACDRVMERVFALFKDEAALLFTLLRIRPRGNNEEERTASAQRQVDLYYRPTADRQRDGSAYQHFLREVRRRCVRHLAARTQRNERDILHLQQRVFGAHGA